MVTALPGREPLLRALNRMRGLILDPDEGFDTAIFEAKRIVAIGDTPIAE